VKLKYTILLGLTLTAQVGFSQEEASKVDLYAEFSFLRFNPSLTGLPSRDYVGGGLGGTFFFNKHFGVKGEFMRFDSTTWREDFEQEVMVTPHGTQAVIPAGTYSASGDLFTYQFGPEFRIPWRHATLFGETLFGGSSTNGYRNLERDIDLGGGTLTISGSQHPFSMAVGGGVDLNVSKNVAIRVAEFDYFLTRYTNPITSTNNQNNFRYLAGFVFKFN
jgi:opacity protein-like surface antigen